MCCSRIRADTSSVVVSIWTLKASGQENGERGALPNELWEVDVVRKRQFTLCFNNSTITISFSLQNVLIEGQYRKLNYFSSHTSPILWTHFRLFVQRLTTASRVILKLNLARTVDLLLLVIMWLSGKCTMVPPPGDCGNRN